MNDNIIFCKDKWLFELTIPEYETTTFGGKMSELRLTKNGIASFSPDNIKDYLFTNDILACTFRGREDTLLVQYLNVLGFKFIGTFNTMVCEYNEFKHIAGERGLKVCEAEKKDYEEILSIEDRVFDYSTYQLDPSFQRSVTAYRNVLRVKSYLGKPNHCMYVAKHNNKVIGFLQFMLDCENKIANCVNGAVDPDYHNLFTGPELYSYSFGDVLFSSGMRKIISGCSNQNIPVLKIHRACGFRITDQEIHLRLKI